MIAPRRDAGCSEAAHRDVKAGGRRKVGVVTRWPGTAQLCQNSARPPRRALSGDCVNFLQGRAAHYETASSESRKRRCRRPREGVGIERAVARVIREIRGERG